MISTNRIMGTFVREYSARRVGVSEKNHYRVMLLARELMASEITSVILIAGVHGGGSPQMEDIAILQTGNLKGKKEIAKYLAGIVDD